MLRDEGIGPQRPRFFIPTTYLLKVWIIVAPWKAITSLVFNLHPEQVQALLYTILVVQTNYIHFPLLC